MKQSTIAVIGGTGKAGSYLVQELIRQHYQVRMLVRRPETVKISDPLIEIVPGNVEDPDAIRSLIRGCDAIISTLGMGTAPNPATIFSTSTRHILDAIPQQMRYIVITGLNVDAPADRKSAKTEAATDWMKEKYPQTTADKQQEYELLAASDRSWTLVRLPMIQLTDEVLLVKIDLEDCPGDGISAASLAVFLTEQLSDERFVRQAPFIATA